MAYNPQTQVNNSDGVPTSVGFNADSIYMPVQVQNGVTITSMPAIQTTPGVTITALQGTPLSPTLANSWPVNVVSSVPNLTLTSLPTVTINTPTVNQGTAGAFTSPWPVTNLLGNTITVLQSTAASLQTTAVQGTPLSPTLANSWPVNVVSSVPNLTLTSLPTVTINTPTVNQGTPASFANAWPVVNLNGNTISALQSGAWTVTANQGTPLSPTLANSWPVNVVSSVPNLTISSMPNIAVTPGTTITNLASVTSGSPSYTPGTFQPLSLDTAGNLRVNVIQTVGGTSSGGVTPVQAATLGGVTITGMGVPGTPDNSSITVQGITNMVPVAVNTIPYQNQVTISGIGFTQGSFKIVPAVTNKRIKVSAYSVISSATTYTDVAFQDGGTRVWAIGVQAPPGTVTGANLAVEPPAFLFATSASNALHMSLSQPQGVTYSVLYWTDDAF